MEFLRNESIYRDRYRILRRLGEGGSSVVYMAVDQESGLPVTVKIIKDMAFCGKDAAEIVKEETRLLARMDHPSIPKLVETYEDAFVLEYIPGNSLEKVLKARGKGRKGAHSVNGGHETRGKMREKDAVSVALEILEILKYLHGLKQPVIYRDLKPSNVMIKPDGHVALIDFGAARIYSDRGLEDTLNLGTSGFAAPEQYGSLGQTDTRTDIYCFGKTLLQMVGEKSSPELLQIIDKCTRPDREDRFTSCDEIEQALRKYPLKKFFNTAVKNLRLAAAAALIALVVSFGVSHYDAVVSYAASDAEIRMPAVKERLGNAGVRIKELLEEKDLWPVGAYESDR